MRKLLSFLKWSVIGAVALILLLAVVFAVYTRTEHFHRLVEDQVIEAVNEAIPGKISLERLEGTLWGDIVLRHLRVHYENKEIAHLPIVKISYSWRRLLRGEFQLSRVEAVEPVLRLRRSEDGVWNIAAAFSSSESKEPSTLALSLNQMFLRQANIEVTLSGAEPQVYRLTGLDLAGRLALEPGGLEAEIREIASRLEIPELPVMRVKGALNYRDTSGLPILTARTLAVEMGASRVELDGQLEGFEKPDMQAKVVLKHLAAHDVARFVPDWPLKQPVTGTVGLKGTLGDLETSLQLAAAGAHVNGRLHLNLTNETPVFKGKFNVAGVDARQFAELKQVAGVLSGDLEVKGRGAELEDLEASGDLAIRSAEAAGWILGNVVLRVRLKEKIVSSEGKLKGELGSADWNGQVTLKDTPSYQMDVAVRNLDIRKVSREGGITGGRLNFEGSIKGKGFDLRNAKTQVELQILPSVVDAVRIQEGNLKASLADSRIRIARAALKTADTSLTVSGDIGVDLSQDGTLVYDFRSQDITSWMSMVGRTATGSVRVKGRAQGNLTRLKTEGTAQVGDLRMAGISLSDASVSFDLARNDKHTLPEGALKTTVRGFQGGVRLRRIDAAIKIAPEQAAAIRIDGKAQDESGRTHALAGEVGWRDNELTARLGELSLQLPDGHWRLARPATIKKIGEEVSFDRVALRNGRKDFAVEGSVSFPGKQSLNLSLNDFPLEALAAFLPKEPTMTGILTMQGRIAGTAAAPEITASARLRDTTIGGQTYAGALADLQYQGRRARVNLEVQQDSTHTLTLDGTLPIALSWHDGWRSELTGAMNFRVHSAGLSLAFLNAYSGKSVEEVAGDLLLDMRIRGTLKDPDLLGTFRLKGGKLKVIPLGVQIHDVAAAGSVDAKSLRIESFSARAAEGRLEGQGLLALDNYQAESFKLSLDAKRWPAINTKRYRADTNGRLEIQGPLTAPRVTGELQVVEGNLRPDLQLLEKNATAVTRDETIKIVRGKDPKSATRNANGESPPESENALFKKTALDITIRVPGNFWIRHPDARVELRGRLNVKKSESENVDLIGTTEIVRGWVAFQGRRFNLTRGRIEFTGGDEIDPTLDIVGEHRLPQYQVSALVGGTAQNPSLALTSQPSLEQADILSLLLFGKPVGALNEGQQSSLQQNALDVTGDFVASKIGAAVSQALGLDALGLDLGELDFDGGRVGYGRYIGRDTYISVAEQLEGERGTEVKVEYQLAPNWKLGTSNSSQGSSSVEIIWSKQY